MVESGFESWVKKHLLVHEREWVGGGRRQSGVFKKLGHISCERFIKDTAVITA
jgi:hypothetical protein